MAAAVLAACSPAQELRAALLRLHVRCAVDPAPLR